MDYIEYIEESKTWVCPTKGKYKVICVGGGASGETLINEEYYGAPGGTTSFGNLVTAEGGTLFEVIALAKSSEPRNFRRGGAGGFDGINYGGAGGFVDISSKYSSPPCGLGGEIGCRGHGYGASGTCCGNTDYPNYVTEAGKIKVGIFDFEKDDVVICTVGLGGVETVAQKKFTTLTVDILSGRDGVIVVQYLG